MLQQEGADLENGMLRETHNHRRPTTCCPMGKQAQTEGRCACPEVGTGMEWLEDRAHGQISLWTGENVLVLCLAKVPYACESAKTTELCTFSWHSVRYVNRISIKFLQKNNQKTTSKRKHEEVFFPTLLVSDM